MLKDVSVVAFDIDGTLYPAWRLNIRLVGYVLRHLNFYIHYSRVRKIMHRTAPLPDFYEYQGRLLAEELDCTVDEAKEKIQRIVYDGMLPYFEKVKPYRDVQKCFLALKDAGYRIALMSDFPPEQKGEMWGLIPYCELILGTEAIGALKPSKYPFGMMAMALNVEHDKILYVGNSRKYDLTGAKNAGMKCAIIVPWWRSLSRRSLKEADFCFRNYRQFMDIVLQ